MLDNGYTYSWNGIGSIMYKKKNEISTMTIYHSRKNTYTLINF